MGLVLSIIHHIFLLPLEVQALDFELRAERAKVGFYERIVDAQDIVLRRISRSLAEAGGPKPSMANGRGDSPVHVPHSLPIDLTEEFHNLPAFVQQYIVSLEQFENET